MDKTRSFVAFHIFLFALWLNVPSVEALYLPPSYRINSQGYASVSVGAMTRNRRSSRVLPLVLSTAIIHNNTIIRLKLVQNNKITALHPVYRPIRGKLIKTLNTELHSNYRFYQDITHQASFHVECKENCGKQSMTGTFFYEGRFYLITPSDDERRNTTHEIFEMDSLGELGMDLINTRSLTFNHAPPQFDRRKRAKDTYDIEIVLVIDYSVFRFWMKESQQNRTVAIDRIYRYYAFLVNGLDMRFMNLPNATFTVGFVFSGIFISESPQDSYWTESNKLVRPSGETQIQVETTLAVFSNWVQNYTASLSFPDHTVLFTKYTLMKGDSSSINGQAYLGAMCSSISQSIVRDSFNFITQTVAAHEIGHSLGAVHDGDQNRCNGSAFYIMSSSNGAQLGDFARHPWIFSSCSVIEIKTVIDKLNNEGQNCLLITSSQKVVSTSQYISRPIGQEFNIDNQCQIIFGPSSYANRAKYKGDFRSICTGLWCSTGGNQLTLIIPADGTTCGSQQWCSGYACVSDLNAPTTTVNCTYGDTPFAAINGLTCQQYIQGQPWQCYNDNVFNICCQSCLDSRIQNSVNCTYGDTPFAAINGLTCQQYIQGQPWQCYNENVFNICCQSCLDSRIQNSDCIYGDIGDCSSLYPGDCYSVALERQCCGFCNRHKANKPSCIYGDRFPGCQRYLCPNYVDITLCCSTCSDYLTTMGTIITTKITTMSSSTTTSMISTVLTTIIRTTTPTKTSTIPATNIPTTIPKIITSTTPATTIPTTTSTTPATNIPTITTSTTPATTIPKITSTTSATNIPITMPNTITSTTPTTTIPTTTSTTPATNILTIATSTTPATTIPTITSTTLTTNIPTTTTSTTTAKTIPATTSTTPAKMTTSIQSTESATKGFILSRKEDTWAIPVVAVLCGLIILLVLLIFFIAYKRCNGSKTTQETVNSNNLEYALF